MKKLITLLMVVFLSSVAFADQMVYSDTSGGWVIEPPPKGSLGIGTLGDYTYTFEVEWKDGCTYTWELELDYGTEETKPTFKWVFRKVECNDE